MRKIFLLLLVALAPTFGWAKKAYDIVFILQDAGETNALLPVIDECYEHDDNFLVITGGQATENIGKKPYLKDNTLSFAQLGISENIDKSWKREDKISKASLSKIKQEIEAKKVVAGVAFELQGQLLKAFKSSETFAYWDNINYEGTNSYFPTAQKVAKKAQHLLVPSQFFLNAYPTAEVVGHPSLELYHQQLSGLRASGVTAKIPFAVKSPVIVFIGGYGKEYDEALREFLACARELKGYTILLNCHPKTDGKIEQEEIKKQAASHIHLIQHSWNINTMEAISIADYVVSHQSMAAVEAACGGKKVIYFIPSHQTFTNLLIEKEGAPVVSNLEELTTSLTPKTATDTFKLLKVPQGSAQLIYDRIKPDERP